MKNITFERSKRFRKYSFILLLVAPTYLSCFEDIWGTLIILAFFFYCGCQYKCPYCGKTLDMWASPDKLQYCPRCGEKLL